jgi:site-specific DNA-methyltransferase (adenine-specific)
MKNKELKDFVYNNVYQNASNGYVITPSELAFEMISKLPCSVFESETTTFLDPICKSGTFLFEIVEKLYEKGHSIKNIESRIYTVDNNKGSLNVAQHTIKIILNKCSGSFKIDYRNDWIERFYNRSISHISQGKYTTFDDFMNIILLDKNKKVLMTNLKNSISDFIQQYEKVSKLESKLFGEVFTPRQLIEEMLDTLPAEVWTNKDLKWLDPAVGIGNFPSVILDRLMVGLEEVLPNEEERRKHILEEMLYMCDISIKNLFLLYKLFDCNNEYKLNVHRGSFLEENFKDKMYSWGIEKFDVIVGNPPYQSSDSTGDNKLYLDFSKRSISLMNENSILLFITPKNIIDYILVCDKNRTYFDDFYQITHLVIDTPSKYFKGVGSTFLYFLLVKTPYIDKTSLTFLDTDKSEKNIDMILIKGESIPNILSKNDISIIEKIKKKSNIYFDFKVMLTNDVRKREFRIRKKQIDNGTVSLIETEEYKYPIIDGIKKTNPFPGKVLYSRNDFSDKKSKVIMNRSGYLCPSYDSTGDYFLSDNLIYLNIENNSEFNNFNSIIESKIFKYWLNQFRLNGFSDEKNLKRFPIIEINKNWTNIELYEYFNLTQEEIDLIEKTIKD